MSYFATERALYDLSGNPECIQQFLTDAAAFLSRYDLTDEEKQLVMDKDVKGLADRGQQHYILMTFWVATSGGFDALPEYLGRLNAQA